MFLCIMALILLSLSKVDLLQQNVPCSAYTMCSLSEDPVWASDGISCSIFRNSCLLSIENCDRKLNNEPVLKRLRKKTCQELCGNVCPEIMAPVCATGVGEPIEFINRCFMNLHSCQTGETFISVEDGPCPLEK